MPLTVELENIRTSLLGYNISSSTAPSSYVIDSAQVRFEGVFLFLTSSSPALSSFSPSSSEISSTPETVPPYHQSLSKRTFTDIPTQGGKMLPFEPMYIPLLSLEMQFISDVASFLARRILIGSSADGNGSNERICTTGSSSTPRPQDMANVGPGNTSQRMRMTRPWTGLYSNRVQLNPMGWIDVGLEYLLV